MAAAGASSGSVLWDGQRAPVTLLGGMLGSGKTTLVNRLATGNPGLRLAILVNDVGEIAVDAALIRSNSDDVIELTNGCVCCSFAGGLGPALEALRDWPEPPERVVIELSGVAKPQRVVPWASSTGFRLDGVVVCADAERIAAQLTDRWLADTAVAQLEAADVVVLTKSDLLSAGGVAAARAAVASRTSVAVVDSVGLDVWPLLGASVTSGGLAESETAVGSEPQWRVGTWRGVVGDRAELLGLLGGLPAGVIRVKGVVADRSGGRWLVQRVGERTEISATTLDVDGLVLIATPEVTIADAVAAMEDRVCGGSD